MLGNGVLDSVSLFAHAKSWYENGASVFLIKKLFSGSRWLLRKQRFTTKTKLK